MLQGCTTASVHLVSQLPHSYNCISVHVSLACMSLAQDSKSRAGGSFWPRLSSSSLSHAFVFPADTFCPLGASRHRHLQGSAGPLRDTCSAPL